jgi:hypothetical protein
LIIVDKAHDVASAPDRLAFLDACRKSGGGLPVIFDVSLIDRDKALPPGAMHLAIDALERRA